MQLALLLLLLPLLALGGGGGNQEQQSTTPTQRVDRQAVEVPEPSMLLGGAIALSMGIAAKKKLRVTTEAKTINS